MKAVPWGFVPALIFLLLFGIVSVHADEMYSTTTHVTFEKNGTGPRDPVSFTMNCYGYTCQRWDCGAPGDDASASDHASDPAFSFHATCPGYGCDVYEPYYHVERLRIDHCDIEGSVGEHPFLIRNYSTTPIPNCSWQDLMMIGSESGTYSYVTETSQYRECMNASYLASEACDEYFAPCDPLKDTECSGNWMVNGSYVKSTPEWDLCMEIAKSERRQCTDYLEPINYSQYVLDERGKPAQRFCELRISLPPDTGFGNDSRSRASTGIEGQADSGTGLFCFLNRIFGGTC